MGTSRGSARLIVIDDSDAWVYHPPGAKFRKQVIASCPSRRFTWLVLLLIVVGWFVGILVGCWLRDWLLGGQCSGEAWSQAHGNA